MNVQQRVNTLGWLSIALGAPAVLAPQVLGRVIGTPQHTGLLRAVGVRELVAGVALLTQERAAPWVWSRVAGDAMDLSLLIAALSDTGRYANRVAGAAGVVLAIGCLDLVSARQVGAQSSR